MNAAGEGNGLGGAAAGGREAIAPVRPALVEVLVAGQSLKNGETMIGVEDGPDLIFRFDQPMDKRSVEAAYSSENSLTSSAHVAFSWNTTADQLRVLPLTALKHSEVTQPDADTELFTVSLGESARSRSGLELERSFEASFRLKKRVTYLVLPDLQNSLWTTRGGVAEPMISEEGLYPDHQWFICPFFELEDRPAEAGPLLLGYVPLRDNYVAYQSLVSFDVNEPEVRSVGIYAFPLPSDVIVLEDASLGVVRWLGNGGSEEEALERADFNVDVLESVETSSATVEALEADLVSEDGNDRNSGYGPFAFDVTDIVDSQISSSEPWSIYRVGVEELGAPDEAIAACAAASLTLVYWAE